jgi:ketose-bisphosphate aldolase
VALKDSWRRGTEIRKREEFPLSFVTLREILADCRQQGWAVPAFDVINLETALAALHGAIAEQAPVILMILPSHTPRKQWPGLVGLIRAEAERVSVPVCLHLDHATDLDQVGAALDLGFSSVMIDGSRLPLSENIALTCRVADEAHRCGVSVEAELGHVGGGDEVLDDAEASSRLTPVEDGGRFVAKTGVDALAVAIGTAHGLYRTKPRLDFERLEGLRKVVPVPLVLHGGSGTPDRDIQRAVAGGICKVNIWTEVAMAFAETVKAQLAVPVEEWRLHQALAAAQASAQAVVQNKIRLLGASGRAW